MRPLPSTIITHKIHDRHRDEIEAIETVSEELNKAADNYRELGTAAGVAKAAKCESARAYQIILLDELDDLRQWKADHDFNI